jgi:hypothetical protein
VKDVSKKDASKKDASKKVTFTLLKSLDEDGILNSFQEEIDRPTSIPEILWMFSRRKGNEKGAFSLKDNLHFYDAFPLKASESGFDGKDFHQDALTEIRPEQGTVYVIPDKPCRLFLDVYEPRVFGNLWCPRKKVILKDIRGNLDSEDSIQIEGKEIDFWFRPPPMDAFPSQSYGQHFSPVDSQITRPRNSVWTWRYFLQAAVSSEGIDLMARSQDSHRPTLDWRRLPSQPRESSPQQHVTTKSEVFNIAYQYSRSGGFKKKGKGTQLSLPPIPGTPQVSTPFVEKAGMGQDPQIASNVSFEQPPISVQPSFSHNLEFREPPTSLPLPLGSRPTLAPTPRQGWFQTLRKNWLGCC